MKKILFTILSLIALIAVIFFINNPSCYDSTYWQEIGLKNSLLYEDVVSQKGEPEEIEYINNECIVKYNDVQFVWYETELKGVFLRAEIIEDTISFGRKQLSIGSSRSIVEKAYKSIFIKKIKDTPMNVLGYIDGSELGIYFYFDEDDKVSKIVLTPYYI